MVGVTIDRIDISSHRQYALNQKNYDPSFIEDASVVPQQSEVLTTFTVPTEWEGLFAWNAKNAHWATFYPPSGFFSKRTRCFSYCLVPFLGFNLPFIVDPENDQKEQQQDAKEDQDDDMNEWDDKESEVLATIKAKIIAQTDGSLTSQQIEKDKTILLNLFDSISSLNGILKKVCSEKLRYQRG